MVRYSGTILEGLTSSSGSEGIVPLYLGVAVVMRYIERHHGVPRGKERTKGAASRLTHFFVREF